MIAVIFEVWLTEDQQGQYLDLAAALRPKLEHIPGFLSIERFQSLSDPQKMLSLSFWQDEQAVVQWRQHQQHQQAQRFGRDTIFQNYRLRIAGVIRDYGMNNRDQAPQSF